MSADAFLSAIADEPHDDTHRLVFADWLDDHGDADRAEFIRLQCRLEGLGEFDVARDDLEVRERELLALHARAWAGEMPAGVTGWRFRRGFVDEVTLAPATFVQEWAWLFLLHPLTAVQFTPQM